MTVIYASIPSSLQLGDIRHSIGVVTATSTAPTRIYGRRRPHRVRVLSDMLPTTGSVTASQIR